MAFSSCAFVTGAGSGIGEAAARRLASDGFAVAVVDVRQDAAARVAEEILSVGGRAISVVADVRDEASVAKGIAQTVEAFGSLTTVFANAGIKIGRAHV